jgi:hypothetical protein
MWRTAFMCGESPEGERGGQGVKSAASPGKTGAVVILTCLAVDLSWVAATSAAGSLHEMLGVAPALDMDLGRRALDLGDTSPPANYRLQRTVTGPTSARRFEMKG